MLPAPVLALAVFALATAYNFIAVRGVRMVVEGSPHRAAMSDLACDLMGRAFLVGIVLAGWWLVIPELLGGYLGTYYGTRRSGRRGPP